MIVLFTHGGNWRRDARRLRASFARSASSCPSYSFPSLTLACLASLAALIFLVFSFHLTYASPTLSYVSVSPSFFTTKKSTLFDETCVSFTLICTIVSTLRSKSLVTVRNFKWKYQIY